MKVKNYYFIIISLIFIYQCENEPINVELEDNQSYQFQPFNTKSTNFQTIQQPNILGKSAKIYLGPLETKKSYGLVQIKGNVFSNIDDLCEVNDILNVEMSLKLKHNFSYSNYNEHSNSFDSSVSNNFENDLSNINAFYKIYSDDTFDDLENQEITFDEVSDYLTIDSSNVYIDSLRLNSLELSLGSTFLNINLNTMNEDNGSIIDLMCDQQKNIVIFLENIGNDLFILESINNPSTKPYIDVSYQKKELSYETFNKYEILAINNITSKPIDVFIQNDYSNEEFGTVVAFGSIPLDDDEAIDSTNIVDLENLNTQIDLFEIEISPDFHANDSIKTILFSLENIILSSRNYDPSFDNYDENSNIDGTEGNLLYDFGEKFEDCGLDRLCNQDEDNYNPFGTENNGQYDEGENFSDIGINGISDESEIDSLNLNYIDDNYNIDPNNDDWSDCGDDGCCDKYEDGYGGCNDIGNSIGDSNNDNYSIDLNPSGTEGNTIFDIGEKFEGNGLCDSSETFLDYGVNGIPDNLEGEDAEFDNWNDCGSDGCCDQYEDGYGGCNDIGDSIGDPNNDNYSIDLNPSGTESNNIFDQGEKTENNLVWDVGEWFIDDGGDGLFSFDEANYNPYGTEGNGVYDLGEPFDDFGMDGIKDSLEIELGQNYLNDNYNIDPNNDDWNDCGIDGCCDQYEDGYGGCNDIGNSIGDPNNDNYNIDINPSGTEANSIFDHGEKWEGNNVINWNEIVQDSLYDIQELENINGEKWYDWGVDQIVNDQETYLGSFPLSVALDSNFYYISELETVDEINFNQPDTSNIYDANLWISKIKKVDSDNLLLTISIVSSKNVAGIQFDLDHVKFSNLDSLWINKNLNINFVDSEQLIDDVSIYKQEEYDYNQENIIVSYGESYSIFLDFPDLNQFIIENENAIISNAILTLYPDTLISKDDDSFRLFLKRAISDYVDGQYLDSDFILDLPYYSSFDFAPDSIQFNIKRYIQKLVTNEYDYHGLILSTDGLNGNFDIFQFKNSIEKQVKLDILYTK
ncbi:MAG: hypothetical protein CMF80_00675 [Candidatus Marinimicrobia bacterium]|nr:hypothetical protein [Candidatus Neomarinimicrobiota bacterium]